LKAEQGDLKAREELEVLRREIAGVVSEDGERVR
jgi:hypothetical protein